MPAHQPQALRSGFRHRHGRSLAKVVAGGGQCIPARRTVRARRRRDRRAHQLRFVSLLYALSSRVSFSYQSGEEAP
jgi:hypothetical protein